MSQRISLTRIVAINWYGFRQIFDVSDNVLISGGFGTGKSALLDLMQYVLLGEHWRANRAAAGNAKGRDLVGYCLGDTNQSGKDGGRHFLRRNGVTLIALEFTRPAEKGDKEPRRETWGVRLEFSSPDARPKHTYFFVSDRLEYSQVAPDGKILSEDEFKTWIRREGFSDFLLTERQGEYLREMATPRHLNFDDMAFHKTFPKAIAFELEDSVERFIREFILEESPLDVAEVRNSLRAYDDIRKRLEKQEDEAAYLRRISEQHALYETSRREMAVLKHTEQTLKLVQHEERQQKLAEAIQQFENEHASDLKELEAARIEAARIKTVLDGVRFQVSKDPDAVKIAELKGEMTPLQNKVRVLTEARTSARQQLDARHYRWTQWLKHAAALPLEGLSDAVSMDEALLGRLRSGSDAERFDAMSKLATCFQQMWLKVEELAQPLTQSIKDAEKRLQQLAADLENLSKGQAPGAFPLFQALRQKLGHRVDQLGRLIEVKPDAERWWPALELFLARNRWVLVVNDPDDYRVAVEILRKTPPGREPESLLNPHEARQLRRHGDVREQTLFSKVEVANPVARHFVEHLLGDVLCVETLDELESTGAARAITPEGIFKSAPLRRRLKPATTVELTLGREGLARMKTAKEKDQHDTRAEHTALKQRLGDIQRWLTTGKEGGLGDPTLPDLSAELPQLPDYEKKLGSLRETVKLLLTPEREARQQHLEELEKSERGTNDKIAVLIHRNTTFELKVKPQREALTHAIEEVKAAKLEVTASRTRLGQSFTGILEADLLQRRDEFRAVFSKWTECFDAVADAAAKAAASAAEAKQRRNHERVLLATSRDHHGNLVHPEYSNEWSAEDESNDNWDSRLRHLETIELAKSRQLAADRKMDWERRLQDNVLNELNQRITVAKKTIHLLDGYLNQPVGKFRYRISQRKDTAGYGAIWHLLNSGLEPTDPLMASIQDGEIQKAKDELMRAVNATETESGKRDERSLRLLDYRNYHHYDLEMVPADKPEAPAISLGRSGRNLSGGESQAPFFISMLAAFRRVYDRGDRSSVRSQRLGLVVMDEAFSKLSGDGIEDCLTLARNFQLQLVMAFPPERLGVMVPHSQTVVICKKEIDRDRDGYVNGITNIPLISTMAEALDALS
jgi:uncharacterized protein YPO0396